ncbi:MAG: GNAT family N-acetyltransferase [Chloroflexi bacterium]|nr:GNAT family N-acetyltransferase [Chloroflexota bacterium]
MREEMELATERLVIRPLTDEAAMLAVYEQCADYLELQTPERPSGAMVQSDVATTARLGGVFAGIYRRESNDLIGVISFVPQNFRGQRDYAFVLNLMIGAVHRRLGYGTEAYQAVEEFIWRDAEVQRIGALLLPQHEPSYAFAKKQGFERAGGPFKNKRGYGLWAFSKKRPGLAETPGEVIWRETQKVLGGDTPFSAPPSRSEH